MSKTNGTIDKLSLLKAKKPREANHAVVLDHEAVEAYAIARRELSAAQDALRRARRLNEAEATMDELQAAVDEAQEQANELEPAAEAGVVQVKLRAMAPLAYRALKAQYPPTEDDHKRVRGDTGDDKAKARWNEAEFAPRLVSACLVDPAASPEVAGEFREAWGEPDWVQLVAACMTLHEQTVDTASLGNSFGRTRS